MGFQTPQFFILMVTAFALFWAAKGHRLLVLAVFDCLFYIYAGWLDFGLLVAASLVSYFSALEMNGRYRKLWVVVGVSFNVLNLMFFKYYYFALDNASRFVAVPPSLRSLKVVLPIGISFYSFQLIAYIVDVYRRDIPPIASFLEFWVFISFFGQVVAGPIMRAKDFAPQVAATEKVHFDPEKIKSGLIWFAIGLFKKLVIADSLAPWVDKYFAKGASMSSVDIWLAAYLFGFQIYYDFSAYSDMAVAVGRFFGYRLEKNFNTPYVSQNPSEFWKRWHITLSTWVRDYLYIPMGGSRRGFVRGLVAVILSMCISGLWHGASWNFVLWGIYHGLLSAAHRIWKRSLGNKVKPGRLVSAINAFLFLQMTMIGWVLFRVTDIKALLVLLRKMLTWSEIGLGPHYGHYLVMILGLYCLHLAEYLVRKNSAQLWSWWSNRVPVALRGFAYSVVLMLICLFVRPKSNAFIYFQF